MRRCRRSLAVFLLSLSLMMATESVSAQAEPAPVDLLLILDASGSMWGQIDGENKIVIARRVLAEVLGELADESEVGLIAYGHRREGDCADVEEVVAMGGLDRAALRTQIEALNPKGKTPITAAVRQAFDVASGRSEATTVVLVSDGLETCGGDPCAAVRKAKAAGTDFVMHVVGFDVGKEEISQLECAAQAGGGLYLSAEDAAGLSAALEQAVAMPADVPAGRLSLEAVAEGKLLDVGVTVYRAGTREDVAFSRTYVSADTNPRLLPLADGRYDVEVKAVRLAGNPVKIWKDIEIVEGGTVEKVADFSTGQLSIGVTRNGARSDATVNIYNAATGKRVTGARTYTGEKSNPKIFHLTSDTYDIEIGSVEIADKPTHRWTNVAVDSGETVELSHAFVSGTLRIGAVSGSELLDSLVAVWSLDREKEADRSRTYTHEKSNPSTFEVLPGKYRVTVKPLKAEGDPQRQFEVTVTAGEASEHIIDFAAGS